MKKNLLPLLRVFAAGAAVLMIEFIGQRWLDSAWGSSLDAWGATLSSVLALMSVGYWLGGWAADRWPRRNLVAFCFLGAGVLLSVMALALPSLMPSLADAVPSTRLGPLLAALFFLGPPVALLSCISPITIRLLQEDAEHAGRTAGRVYAVGTAGSILGALLVPYFLLGAFSLPTLFAALAFSLALAAVPGSKGWRLLPVFLVMLVSVSIAFATSQNSFALKGNTLEVVSSPYQTITIQSEEGVRVMTFLSGPDAWQGAWDPRDPDYLQFAYTRAMQRWRCAYPRPRRALVIGVGAGSLVRGIRRLSPTTRVDGVELDGDVLRVSRQWMGLPRGKGISYHVADGRKWLQDSASAFDLVMVDAFSGSKVPSQFLTQEFFDLLRERTSAKGLVAMNIIASPDEEWVGSLLAAARRSFSQAQIYSVSGQGGSKNLLLFAGSDLSALSDKRCILDVERDAEIPSRELERAGVLRVREREPWTDLTSPSS